MKPHGRMTPTSKTGVSNGRSRGANTPRLSGATRSAIATRATSADSAESTAATCVGSRHHASTGVTSKRLCGTKSGGSIPMTSTPAGSSPVSSSASRRAVKALEVSVSSRAPPGKAGCPA